jgi:hypothetical protein
VDDSERVKRLNTGVSDQVALESGATYYLSLSLSGASSGDNVSYTFSLSS